MSQPAQSSKPARRRRRYLVHLLCAFDRDGEGCRYIARIRPWSARSGAHAESRERVFADDCELIATINRLLPPGSDVRDIFEHIESPNGFFYLLHLTIEEAGQLGWGREGRHSAQA